MPTPKLLKFIQQVLRQMDAPPVHLEHLGKTIYLRLLRPQSLSIPLVQVTI